MTYKQELEDTVPGEIDVPADEGLTDEEDLQPQSWVGSLSDSAFTARFEDDTWILGVRTEAQTPVLIQNPYLSIESLQEHAEMFDFALSLARGEDNITDAEIEGRAMQMTYVRDFYRVTGQNLKDSIKLQSKKVEFSPESLAGLERGRISATALMRIADRLEVRMKKAIDPALLACIETAPPSKIVS
jgi:hypothetical protein